MPCQDQRELNCDSCYSLEYEYCSSISVSAGLTPDDVFFLHIIDKFENKYTQSVTVLEDGSFDVDLTVLPEGYFNPWAGVFEAYISETEDGEPMPMTIESVEYNCLLITITE